MNDFWQVFTQHSKRIYYPDSVEFLLRMRDYPDIILNSNHRLSIDYYPDRNGHAKLTIFDDENAEYLEGFERWIKPQSYGQLTRSLIRFTDDFYAAFPEYRRWRQAA